MLFFYFDHDVYEDVDRGESPDKFQAILDDFDENAHPDAVSLSVTGHVSGVVMAMDAAAGLAVLQKETLYCNDLDADSLRKLPAIQHGNVNEPLVQFDPHLQLEQISKHGDYLGDWNDDPDDEDEDDDDL